MKFKCPICQRDVDVRNKAVFPFCSSRCKLVDLGAWFDANYTIKDSEEDYKEEQ